MAQGKNAGHCRRLTAGAAQGKCGRCGMRMSGGGGGGGGVGGEPFYKTVRKLKGFQR